jgi:hypothetical protein
MVILVFGIPSGMGSKAVQTQILDADADVVEYDPISFP